MRAGGLGEENTDAWALFCAAATRSEITIEDRPRDVFEMDWQLVRLLLDTREITDRAETVERMLTLLKDLNAR